MNISDIKDKVDRGEQIEYLFFWSHRPNADGTIGNTCFSQWFDASFELNGIHYQTAEHYMMAEKARCFDDCIILTEILVEASPDDRIWWIGLAADNPNIENPHCWKGSNLLGFALMEVRSILQFDRHI
jgi:predicted NAD-dependent protein-ADP-ribosyltransferase YbiA (DUF1768 family)